jgi:hypothetical protein
VDVLEREHDIVRWRARWVLGIVSHRRDREVDQREEDPGQLLLALLYGERREAVRKARDVVRVR